MRNRRCAVLSSASAGADTATLLAVTYWSMLLVLMLSAGCADSSEMSSALVLNVDDCALVSPPTKAVDGYRPANLSASAFANRAVRCVGVSLGSTGGTLVAS